MWVRETKVPSTSSVMMEMEMETLCTGSKVWSLFGNWKIEDPNKYALSRMFVLTDVILIKMHVFRLGQFWYVGPALGTESGAYLRAPVQGERDVDPIWIEVSGSMEPPPHMGWQFHTGNNTRCTFFSKPTLKCCIRTLPRGGKTSWEGRGDRARLGVQSPLPREISRYEGCINPRCVFRYLHFTPQYWFTLFFVARQFLLRICALFVTQ